MPPSPSPLSFPTTPTSPTPYSPSGSITIDSPLPGPGPTCSELMVNSLSLSLRPMSPRQPASIDITTISGIQLARQVSILAVYGLYTPCACVWFVYSLFMICILSVYGLVYSLCIVCILFVYDLYTFVYVLYLIRTHRCWGHCNGSLAILGLREKIGKRKIGEKSCRRMKDQVLSWSLYQLH